MRALPMIQYDVARMIESWEPPDRPHCSNCAHCRVLGTPADPMVRCAAGYGRVQDRQVELGRVIRQRRPVGFRNAADCPAYTSMDDEPGVGFGGGMS